MRILIAANGEQSHAGRVIAQPRLGTVSGVTKDPFASAVSVLARRLRHRHTPEVVNKVALTQWLRLHTHFDDPYDPRVFEQIFQALMRTPPTLRWPHNQDSTGN